MKPNLLRHLSGENIGRFPVWMMRQAGRYLPSYQAVRRDHSFWEMVTTPELAAKVSLLPLEVLPVDGVIFFSDILTLPYGMGMGIEMKESIGPVVQSPLRSSDDFRRFRDFDPTRHVPYVGLALEKIREKTPAETALLGFAGAPWTVGAYLTEGHLKKRQFAAIKGWMYRDPAGLRDALSELAGATVSYLTFQHNHGAHLVQLFDTWLSEVPRDFFRDFYRPVLNRIFEALRAEGIPVIYFSKGTQHLLEELEELKADVLSVDNLLPLGEVDRRLGGRFSLQGNLDPVALLGDETLVRALTRRLVEEARTLKRPAILNLGHGIFPETPVANAKAFVEEARALWD